MIARCTCLLLLAAVAVSAGCDESGPAASTEGPSSSSASAGGSGGSAGAGGSGGEVIGSGGFPDACDKLCTKFDELGCDLACEALCPGWIEHAGECSYQMAAELDCIAESTTQCGQDVCQEEYAALDECAGGEDCFVGSCKGTSRGGTQTCGCVQGCSTGKLEVECITTTGPTTCDCFIGGSKVGSCEQSRHFCDVEYGCCDRFF